MTNHDLFKEDVFPTGTVSGTVTEGCLVLESGAFRGIYQQGVLDALLEEGILMQCAVGVSVGALNGAAYVAGKIGQSIRVAIDNQKNGRFVGMKAMRENHGPIGFQFMFEQLKDWDEASTEQFFSPDRRFVVVATNMLTGEPVYFERSRNRRMKGAVQASASMPYISRPIVIGKTPYLDGGCSVRIPYQWALNQGYSKTIVVRTRPEGFRYRISRPAYWAARSVYRKYAEFAETLGTARIRYNSGSARLEKLAREGQVYMIAPSSDLLNHLLQRDSDSLTALYRMGYQETKEQMKDLRAYLES